MDGVMSKGAVYFIDHPLFDGCYFLNGKLCPGDRGQIALSNGSLKREVMEGKLLLGPERGRIPRELSEKITVQGMRLIFPDASEVDIYERGSEPPSTKAEREARFEAAKSKFLAQVDHIVTKIMTKIGSASSPDASKALQEILADLKHRDAKGHLILRGYLQALEAVSVLTAVEVKALGEDVRTLTMLGEMYRSFLPPR